MVVGGRRRRRIGGRRNRFFGSVWWSLCCCIQYLQNVVLVLCLLLIKHKGRRVLRVVKECSLLENTRDLKNTLQLSEHKVSDWTSSQYLSDLLSRPGK